MMMYGHGTGVGWTLIAFVVALPALLIATALIFAQVRRTPDNPSGPDPAPAAERILADRFARGEIDTEEYDRRLHTLRAARP